VPGNNFCRILAHAGFDAREAVKFWETRSGVVSECATSDGVDVSLKRKDLARRIMGSTHPVHELRVTRLRGELARWETERQSMIARLRASQGADGVVKAA